MEVEEEMDAAEEEVDEAESEEDDDDVPRFPFPFNYYLTIRIQSNYL